MAAAGPAARATASTRRSTRWAAAVLPPPADVGWLATTAKGDTVELRLNALAVSALDACVLASDDPASITPALRRLAELANPQHALGAHRPSEGGAAPVTLAEFQLLAVELKRVIQESTPADGSSVTVPGGDAAAAPDARETIGRASDVLDDVLATFDAVASAKDWATTDRRPAGRPRPARDRAVAGR